MPRALPPVLAVVIASVLCGGLVAATGGDPGVALWRMLTRVGEGGTAVDIVNSAAAYYLAALAVAIAFQLNLINIGVEGQYRLGAVTAAVVAGSVSLPAGPHTLLSLVVAMTAGAVWAGIAAVLKVFRGVHEVISTIMLNAVAVGLAAWLLSPELFGVPKGNNISTRPIAETGWFPGVDLGSAGTLFGMVPLVVALGVGYWVLLNRTRFGFELQAAGESPTAAAAGGVRPRRLIISTMLLSGAVAGLAGLPEILGRDHSFSLTFPQGYGLSGIAIALLGRNHPLGIAFGALLWAFLDRSAVVLEGLGVADEIVLIMQAVIVLSVVVAYEIARRMDLRTQRRAAATAECPDTGSVAVGQRTG